jgi:hypothetical protein
VAASPKAVAIRTLRTETRTPLRRGTRFSLDIEPSKLIVTLRAATIRYLPQDSTGVLEALFT